MLDVLTVTHGWSYVVTCGFAYKFSGGEKGTREGASKNKSFGQ